MNEGLEAEIGWLTISRIRVDKLGFKLCDKVSAATVNAYDTHTAKVTVCTPVGQLPTTRAGGAIADKSFGLQVVDKGSGMTQAGFLYTGLLRICVIAVVPSPSVSPVDDTVSPGVSTTQGMC